MPAKRVAARTGEALSSLLFGLTLAGVALVRAAFFPFALVGLLWFVWKSRDLARGWFAALLAVLGFVNGVGPWCVRNYQIFHDGFEVTGNSVIISSINQDAQLEIRPLADGIPEPAETVTIAER